MPTDEQMRLGRDGWVKGSSILFKATSLFKYCCKSLGNWKTDCRLWCRLPSLGSLYFKGKPNLKPSWASCTSCWCGCSCSSCHSLSGLTGVLHVKPYCQRLSWSSAIIGDSVAGVGTFATFMGNLHWVWLHGYGSTCPCWNHSRHKNSQNWSVYLWLDVDCVVPRTIIGCQFGSMV